MVGSPRTGRIGVAGMVFLLMMAACGDDDALQPGPVTSFEDIAGTYERQGPGGQFFLHFFEDGRLHQSSSPDLIVDRPSVVWQTRSEGTEIFITGSTCDENIGIDAHYGGQPDQGGTYELLVLENGNVEFVAVGEDGCAGRSSRFQVEWAPVP